MSIQWHGVFPAVTTKFTATLDIDRDLMARHIQAQLEAGVNGIIVLGTLGENPVLSFDEKLAVVEHAAAVIDGRVPLVATVAETTTAGACRFAQEAASRGADGFMVLPGMLYVSDRRETIAHFRAVADATERPIMIYNNPVSYKVDVTPDMFEELADEPKFQAIKESSDNVRRITDIINRTGDRYRIFTGVDDLALESLMLGAVGWVAGLVCAFPRETVRIYDLAKEGRYEEARALYRWFMPLLHLDVSTKLVQNIKLAEAMVGLGSEYVRPPRLPLVGEERDRVVAVIQDALAKREALQPALGS
ncbi:MAG: dihydrodipicolinate synthase family protein [Acidobacteriota bacterium]|nr:dihydrodipicolinate synthase family protein [Acidobacteriota bacterium]